MERFPMAPQRLAETNLNNLFNFNEKFKFDLFGGFVNWVLSSKVLNACLVY